MKLLKFAVIVVFLLTNMAYAQVEDNANEISIFASVCENILQNESKSSARLRASDKASFKAVSEIPELSDFRQYLDPHKFNIKVYKLIDNYLEDLTINVVNQDTDKVCVEVSAYLLSNMIKEVFDDVSAEMNTDTNLEIEAENVEENVSITIPPKPQININDQIAYDDDDEKEVEIIREINYHVPENKKFQNKKVSIFIDRTQFYNDTSTNGFFAHLEQEILKKGDVVVHAKFDNSNYILKTKVLKAKVDNINTETARLHVVISVELTDTSNSETTTEHQNRFVLFNTSEDAQTKASELVKKLFADGIAKLLPKIKLSDEVFSNDKIITPPTK